MLIGVGASALTGFFLVVCVCSHFNRHKILDSTQLGPYRAEGYEYQNPRELKEALLKFDKLERLADRISLMECRRVIPATFTGFYGFDYITYTVDQSELRQEINTWIKDPDAVPKGHWFFADREAPPKWWPDERNLEFVVVLKKDLLAGGGDQTIWVNRNDRRFFVYCPWGH